MSVARQPFTEWLREWHKIFDSLFSYDLFLVMGVLSVKMGHLFLFFARYESEEIRKIKTLFINIK